ncbi:MAG: ABC transporter permease [Acidimicrobiia bacterium]|jgi:lipooligosaccharide transport system permease protein
MAVAAPIRVLEAQYRTYRRTWRGSVISTFLQPVLFLTAIGVGLGTLVDDGAGTSTLPIAYLAFLATGILPATAMQTGSSDGAWPVMAGFKWRKDYYATIATPITVRDLILGRFGFAAIRLTFVLTIYTIIMALFDAVPLWPGVLGIPPAVLTGLAFTALVTAYTCTLENEIGLANLFRFGIVPLFLFSGTFFPVSQLPDWLEPLAPLTPLYHGVELVRKLVLSDLEAPLVSSTSMWVHLAYLVVVLVVGTALAVRFLDRKLLV